MARKILKIKHVETWLVLLLLGVAPLVGFSQVVVSKVGLVQRGEASYYPDNRNGAVTRSGEAYDMTDFTGAHRALAFNSLVRVTNLDNGQAVVVRINDRPYTRDRIIDLTLAAAQAIGLAGKLSADVKIEVVGLDGSAPQTWLENVKLGHISMDSVQRRFPPRPLPNAKPQGIPTGTAASPTANFSLQAFEDVGTYLPNGQATKVSGYAVQVASFADAASAIETCTFFAAQLQFKNVFVQSGWTDGQKAYRVIIGIFSNKEAAADLKNLLRASGYDAIVRNHYD